MTDYLLKSTYTYGTKRLTDFAITTADSKTTAEFEVTYEEVFIQTGMNPQCNFVDPLQWGFRNPSSTSWYYMGPDTTVAGNPLIFTCVCLLLCLELSKEEMFCLIPKRFDDMLLIDVVVILDTMSEARFRNAVHFLRDAWDWMNFNPIKKVQCYSLLCPNEVIKETHYSVYHFAMLFE